jgi:hypothetical protein
MQTNEHIADKEQNDFCNARVLAPNKSPAKSHLFFKTFSAELNRFPKTPIINSFPPLLGAHVVNSTNPARHHPGHRRSSRRVA